MTPRITPSRPDARLRRAIERSPEPTWLADRHGRWTWVSAAWTRLTGQSCRAALGDGWLTCLEPAAAKALRHALAELAERGGSCAQEASVARTGGGRARLVFDAIALSGADDPGDPTVVLGRCRAPAAPALAAIPQEWPGPRDHVLALVSHELRSPLNGIQSWAHVLENHLPDGSDGARRALAGIRTGVAQQVGLIDGLIDATQVMTGRPLLASRRVTLEEPVRRAVARMERASLDRLQSIACTIPSPAPAVIGDADRIEQVVVHLLSNAVKFAGPQAAIGVTVAADPATGIANVTVTDDGPGLPVGLVDAMFEPFSQADLVTARASSGLGLGLALARRLTELMGGSLDAEPGAARGARLVVRLPLAVDSGVDVRPSASRPALQGMRLMLVDDQREARDALTELLRHAGARVDALPSGLEAVRAFGALGRDARPDVLICDIAMPGLDGYATLQRIRAIERSVPVDGVAHGIDGGGRADGSMSDEPLTEGMPAIALTAFAQRADRVRALLGGFHVHLAKPVDPGDLIAILSALGARRPAAAGSR